MKAAEGEALKTVSTPMPMSLYEQAAAFLEANKGKEGYPQSLRELVKLCVKHTLDHIEAESARRPDDAFDIIVKNT